DHGLAEVANSLQDGVQPLGVDLPTEVGALARAGLDALAPGPADDRTAVVVHADPVELGQRAVHDTFLPEPVASAGHDLVDRAPPPERLHRPDAEGHTDHRVGSRAPQQMTDAGVGARRVAHQAHVPAQVAGLERGPTAFEIPLETEDAGLVYRDPPAHQVVRLV